MKQLWQRYADRIDEMTLRERVLMFAAATLLLVTPIYAVLIDGQLRLQRQLSSGVAQKQSEAKVLEAQLTKLATGREKDPDRPLRERLAVARSELAEVERMVGAEERKFTAPEQMKKVIEEMLARNSSVRLVAMKTLATTSIAESRAAITTSVKPPAAATATPPSKPPAANPGERLIYRHGIEVTVQGAYLDLLRYLSDLERLPTQLYWGSLQLDATRYPTHSMKIVVYTLSLDPAWLSL